MSMGRYQPHGLAAITAGLMCLALAGCGGSSTTRYYSLQPSSPSAASKLAYVGPALQISSVHVPSELDRNELLREVAPGQFEVREFDHWTAPLGQMAQQILSEDLSSRLPAGSLIYPDAFKPNAAANLSVDILTFRQEGDRAVMQVSWSMRLPPLPQPSPGRGAASSVSAVPAVPPVTVCGSQLRLSTPGSSDAAGTSSAFSSLLGQLADRIADGLVAGCSQATPPA